MGSREGPAVRYSPPRMATDDFEGETHLLRSAAREVTFRRFGVVVVQGLDQGKSFAAPSQELGIGTAPGNDLVVTDPKIGRAHV